MESQSSRPDAQTEPAATKMQIVIAAHFRIPLAGIGRSERLGCLGPAS